MPSRILIIEDHIDGALTLQTLLRLMGHEATVAFTGPAGVQLARDWKPEVVLSDIGLPGLDGFEVARELRHHPGTENILLIAISGYGSDEDREKGDEAGFDYYFVKPLDPELLSRLLRRPASREAIRARPVSPAGP